MGDDECCSLNGKIEAEGDPSCGIATFPVVWPLEAFFDGMEYGLVERLALRDDARLAARLPGV